MIIVVIVIVLSSIHNKVINFLNNNDIGVFPLQPLLKYSQVSNCTREGCTGAEFIYSGSVVMDEEVDKCDQFASFIKQWVGFLTLNG